MSLHLGDSAEVLRGMPENSIDAVVCDPPYGLSKEPDMAEVLRHWLAGDDYKHSGGGFMGKAWDSFVPGPALWREVFRVLKPGGHLLAFSGSRTYDLMAVAIRLAGFEVRDQIMWIYGSGFPKSLDVGKAVDKSRGGIAFDELRAYLRDTIKASGVPHREIKRHLGYPENSGVIGHWVGNSQPTVPLWNDWVKMKEILPLDDRYDELLRHAEREVIGQKRTGDPVKWYAQAERGDGVTDITAPATDAARQWQGWGTALKPAHEPIVVARKPLEGTVAANVLKWGTGALNIDGCRVGANAGWSYPNGRGGRGWHGRESLSTNLNEPMAATQGRWPANVIHDGSEEVVAAFPDAKGQQGALTGSEPSWKMGAANCYGAMGRRHESTPRVESDKSAARFFYCAKASRSERNAGLEHLPELTGGQATDRKDGSKGLDNPRAGAGAGAGAGRTGATRNFHPTVKPIALMRYLCRLVTPPGGTVLDPFMGSGSTGCAAVQEGFNFVGVEMDPEYLEIARARITHWNPEREPEPANDNTSDAEPDSGEEQLDLLAGIA